MLLRLLPTLAFLAVSTSQTVSNDTKVEPKQNQEPKALVLLATPLNESQNQKAGEVPLDIKEFYARQQFSPGLYGLTYLQPQYQAEAALPRLQPQIVLYGPGGQGQPILINPGNPPGNFLIPQGPGPNVILRNNPQGPIFPVAGYPKPAHIPPIEKDAEEIPTNPAKIPPLRSDAKPKPKGKPEKLETFTEPNLPDLNTKNNPDQFPQLSPESVSLRPGHRFFVLNGDHIFSYPFEAPSDIQSELPAFRYTNVQPFPQNPPKFLQPFAQEPPQFLQGSERPSSQEVISVPNLLLRNSFVNSQQPGSQQQPQLQAEVQQAEKTQGDGALRTAQQYFRTGLPPDQALFLQNPQSYLRDYIIGSSGGQSFNQQIQALESVQERAPKDDVVQPQLIGQFRFSPPSAPSFYQFRDDVENDAVVVDASLNDPNNFDRRAENLNEETVSSTTQVSVKQSEPSMAQAGPQATAIAGPGGVAGSAPRGTAIVGKGGLAVSSPQATAVAGTKDEEKKKRPVKKEP